MRIIDRYVVREIIPPFLIALLVFTFVLIIPFIIDLAEQMIAKGVPGGTILQLTITLLPQALALTIPMALLIGLLVGLGRLSADREVVVMMACGISPYRLLHPVLVFAVVCWGLTSWVMLKAMPDGNQKYREIARRSSWTAPRARCGRGCSTRTSQTWCCTSTKCRSTARAGSTSWRSTPRTADSRFFTSPSAAAWLIDREARTIHMVLEDGTRHTTKLEDPAAYEVLKFERTIIALDPESVFPRTGPQRGEREMAIEDLAALAGELEAGGQSPHNPIMEIHKKFSVPMACFVFALLGVALGTSNRKDGKLAAFVLGIGVIFAYYVIMFTAASLTKGFWIPAWLAMWIPDLVLGAAGLFLLVRRARSADQPIRIPLPAWVRRRLSEDDGPAPARVRLPGRVRRW